MRQRKDILTLYSLFGLLLLFVGLIAGIFILPFTITGDGLVRYKFMDVLVHQFQIIPMRYSSVGPLFSLPLWLISLFSGHASAIIARYNFLLFAVFLLILSQWLKGRFDQKFIQTFLFLLAFGSMFPGHLINYYGEVFSAVCLALGTVGLATKKTITGWALLIIAVLNTPALFIPFFLVILYLTWESRQVRYLILIPTCLILLLVESYFRTGNLFAGFQTYLGQDHGYQTILPYSGKTGYSYPFVLGVLSILLSFGKGLVFFCPGLLLIGWTWKTASNPVERKMLILWLLIMLGLVLAYASWWSWYGGWYWGPRFFLFASLPASWSLAKLTHTGQKSLLQSMFLPLLVTFSLWVGVNGVVFQQNTLEICTTNAYALEHLCWYVPEFSPLIRPFIVHAALNLKDRLILILFAIAWLYAMVPLGIDLFRQLRIAFQIHHPFVKLSSWKF
jgi:hypothetical protein